MRKTAAVLLLALAMVPLAAVGASAAPAAELVPAIVPLDSDAGVDYLPAHLPIPAASNGIGPGSPLLITRPDGTFGCTANFIWTKTTTTPARKKNGKVAKNREPLVEKTTYLGAAGHCFLPEDKASTHGPDADYDPALSEVSVCVTECSFGGQSGFLLGSYVKLGPVAYARQARAGVAFTNDFGIVEIPSSLLDEIRPDVPVWGGPSTIEDVSLGRQICLYGNAGGLGEAFPTKGRTGVGQGLDGSGRGWLAVIPSFQGDSGGAIVTCGPDADGVHGLGAAGLVTHIGLLQNTARMLGMTVAGAADMASRDAGIDLRIMLDDGSEVAPPVLPPRTDEAKPVTPDEPTHAIDAGGSHAWTAGPFTRSAPPEAFLLGDACSGTEPATEHCDYEFVDLRVPAEGGTFTTTIASDDPNADFDLFVFDPDGQLIDTSARAGSDEQVTASVRRSGTYIIAVDPYETSAASYSGKAEMVATPPPPPPATDGRISSGTSYEWTGVTPVPTSAVFTCAELVRDTCDNETIYVDVPAEGATLVIDVAAQTTGDDFDACVYTPSGAQTCVSEAGDEHVELPVTQTGVYRVGVKAYLAPGGGYAASAALR